MTAVTPIRTAAEQALIAAYHARPSAADAAVAIRETGFSTFERVGLPHRRIEDWKYTDLRALMREARPFAAEPDVARLGRAAELVSAATADLSGAPIVIVDGVYIGALSGKTPEGVRLTAMADALAAGRKDIIDHLVLAGPARDNAAIALNNAFLRDGVIIEVEAGRKVDQELHIVSVTTDAHLVMSRHLVLAGAGSSVGVLETHIGPEGLDYQKNTVLQVVVGDGATVEHGRRQIEGDKALHLASLVVSIGGRARFDTLTVSTGGQVARNQLFVDFTGEHSSANLRGVAMLRRRQHVDTTLVMTHATPHCVSREVFKHVLDDEARGVFQGKIVVLPVAQKTDGRMMSQCVMLAEGPEMDNKPELEIFADDVQCAHGCTCGRIDEDLLFYLKARGIPHIEAEALLVEAFAEEAIEDFGDGAIASVEDLREAFSATINEWMRQRA